MFPSTVGLYTRAICTLVKWLHYPNTRHSALLAVNGGGGGGGDDDYADVVSPPPPTPASLQELCISLTVSLI